MKQKLIPNLYMPPEGPEAPQPIEKPLEGQKTEPAQPERPLQDIEQAHQNQKERQEERTAKEEPEQKKGEESSEDLLQQELMKELYNDMKNGLTGDAKEVFAVIEGELSDAEKIDLAQNFNDFQEISDQNYANVNQQRFNTPREEYLLSARLQRSSRAADTFQNSIDGMFHKRDTTSTADKQLTGEIIEKTNNQMSEKYNQEEEVPGEVLVWRKMCTLVNEHIKKNPEKTFRAIEKPKVANGQQGDERYEQLTERMTEVLAAENLLFEVDQARSAGLNIVVRSIDDGHELSGIEEIANAVAIKLDITPPKGVMLDIKKTMENTGNRFDSVSGGVTTILGGKTLMREGVENLTRAVKKEQRKGTPTS